MVPGSSKYLRFEVVEKKRIKKSKIKAALQAFKQKNQIQYAEDSFQPCGITANQQSQEELIQNNENDEQQYVTIAEMTENESHIIKQYIPYHSKQIKNYLEGTTYNKMKLRHWVDHEPSQEIDQKILYLVNQLAYKQAMKKLAEPLKYKKRIVAGFKECLKSLKLKLNDQKSKCIILAINLQENPLEGGSDEIVEKILLQCQQKNIPVFHSSSRARLGSAFLGKFGVRIGCLSILNYQSMEQQFNELKRIIGFIKENIFRQKY